MPLDLSQSFFFSWHLRCREILPLWTRVIPEHSTKPWVIPKELYLDVSENSGKTPEIIRFYRVFHEINHLFWGTTIFGNIHRRQKGFLSWLVAAHLPAVTFGDLLPSCQAAVFTLWLRAVHISPTHHFLQSERCNKYNAPGDGGRNPFHGWRMWLAFLGDSVVQLHLIQSIVNYTVSVRNLPKSRNAFSYLHGFRIPKKLQNPLVLAQIDWVLVMISGDPMMTKVSVSWPT